MGGSNPFEDIYNILVFKNRTTRNALVFLDFVLRTSLDIFDEVCPFRFFDEIFLACGQYEKNVLGYFVDNIIFVGLIDVHHDEIL